MKIFLFLPLALLVGPHPFSQRPIPSNEPSKYQLEQIQRKYGMFIHFGVNTFWNEEWTTAANHPPPTIRPLLMRTNGSKLHSLQV
jgi:alpha-L-fucosidase